MLSIINSLSSSKAHRYVNISIKMIKICNELVTIPLKIIFEKSLRKGILSDICKKLNIIPAHRKENNTLINNYRRIISAKYLKE